MRRVIVLSAIVCVASCTLSDADAVMVHRYSFNEAGGTNVTDSVNNANGVLIGPGTLGGGELDLPGGGTAGAPTGGHVDLPNGIISALGTIVTIEAWYTWDGGAVWQRVFDFGASDAGEGTPGAGVDYLFFTPNADGGGQRFSVQDPAPEDQVDSGVDAEVGVEQHMVAVYDTVQNISLLYINGELVDTDTAVYPPSGINDVNNWLGRAQWAGDTMYDGRFNELRIYDHALSALDVQVSIEFGPDDLDGTPGAETGRAIAGQDEIVVQGGKHYTLEISYANLTNPLVLSEDTNLVWSSSDTNIATVAQNGVVFAHSGGNVDISATYDGGAPAVKTIQVTDLALVHRYDFSGPADSDFGGTPIPIEDIEGDADGQLILGDRLGDGTIQLTSGFGAFVDLPNGIISTLGAATFEAFVSPQDDLGGAWQRVFTFGVGGNGEVDEFEQPGGGVDYLNLVQRQNTLFQFVSDYNINASFSTAGEGGPIYTPNQEYHVALVVDPVASNLSMYVDGAPVDTDANEPLFLDQTLNDVNNWLGRSLFDDDSFADAIWNEFRIYQGVVTPFELAVNSAYGADVDPFTDPGTPVALVASTDTPELIVDGFNGLVRAEVDYTLVDGVPVNGVTGVVFTSSDTNVVAVHDTGVTTGVGPGVATVTAEFMGLMDDVQITVISIAKPAQLAHRYSFDGAPGSTVVVDSVGGKDGQVVGPLTYTGTELDFPGGGTSADATNGYVNLPNNLIADLGTNAFTIQTWFTWDGDGPSGWQRVFDFGTSVGGEDVSDSGETTPYMFLTPSVGTAGTGEMRFTVTLTGDGGEFPLYNAADPAPVGQEICVTITYDADDELGRMFINGVQEGETYQPNLLLTDPLWVNNENNVWLGRSQWNDADLDGRINEFRVYTGILSPSEVLASVLCGPDNLFPDCPTDALITGVELSDSNLILQWPEAGGDSVLSTTDLIGGEFSDTGVTVTTSNGTNEATIPLGAEAAESFTTGTVDP